MFGSSTDGMINSGTGVLVGGASDSIQNAAPTELAQIAKRAILAFDIEPSSARPFPSILKADFRQRRVPRLGDANQPSSEFRNPQQSPRD
jgi:hypothetical protein